jgi:SM-20-related protein
MLDQILRELESKGYCYIPKLVDDDSLHDINNFFDLNKDHFDAAKVGPKDKKQRVESIRGDFTYWIDPQRPQMPFASLFQFLQELKDAVNKHFFLGLKEFESHLAYYPPGTFYSKHLDRFASDSSRRLTFIYYLNQEWKKEDGGELVIYDKRGTVVETVYPMPGSFLTFLSDEFPHEVKAGKKERRSFTGWMHTKIIY